MAGCPICEDLHHGASTCPHSLVGAALGKYEVTTFLAAGGMGAVYAGKHQTLGSPIAVKTLHRAFLPQNAKTPDRRKLAETLVQRFTDEARRAASLRHQNIVRVEDLGVAPDGTPYLAMEFLEGMSLKELVETQGPLEPARAAELVAQALDALEFAHQRNIIHRDIKPENLYLQHPGQRTELVKVLDFGIAKAVGDGATQFGLTQTGHGAMGTFYYMSPEQAKDPRKVTASSDVFSVGASLFELLTGRNVLHEIERELTTSGLMAVQFLHGVLTAIIEGNIERSPKKVRPSVPDWLDAIVARSLAHDPADRYASAGEMAAVLHAGAGGKPVSVSTPAARSNPVALAATAPSQAMAAAGGSQPQIGQTHVAPPVPDGQRPSAQILAARAASQSDGAAPAARPHTGPVLGSTTANSAGERVVPVSHPSTAPARSKTPLVLGAAVVLAGAGVALALSLGGGGEPGGETAASAGALDAGQVAETGVDAAAAPSSTFADVTRLANSGDCAGAAEAYDPITDTADARGRADALVSLGNCESAAGQRDQARIRYERAMAVFPDHAGATIGIAALDGAGGHPASTPSPKQSIAETPAAGAAAAKAIAPSGIKVNTTPPVQVFIDGKSHGTTPVGWVEVKPGRHSVRLVNRDLGINKRMSVRVKPGERKVVAEKFSQIARGGAGGKGGTVASDGGKSGCDEASCLVNPKKACCRGIAKAATPTTTANVPERLTRSDISSAVGRLRGRVRACGDKHPAKGTVKVKVKIAPSGAASSVSVVSAPSPALGSCVAAAMKRIKAPRSQRGQAFTYPFVFR